MGLIKSVKSENSYEWRVYESVLRDLESSRNVLQRRIDSFVLIISFVVLMETTLAVLVVDTCLPLLDSTKRATLSGVSLCLAVASLIIMVIVVGKVIGIYRKQYAVYLIPDSIDVPILPDDMTLTSEMPAFDPEKIKNKAIYPVDIEMGQKRWLYQVVSSLHDQLRCTATVSKRFRNYGVLCVISLSLQILAVMTCIASSAFVFF